MKRWLWLLLLLCSQHAHSTAHEEGEEAWNCLFVNLVSQTNVYSVDRAISVHVDMLEVGDEAAVDILSAAWAVVRSEEETSDAGDAYLSSPSDPVPVGHGSFLFHFLPDELVSVLEVDREWGWRRLTIERRWEGGELRCQDDVVVRLHSHGETAATYTFESPSPLHTPRIVHFIHLQLEPRPRNTARCDELLSLSVRSTVNHIQPERIYLHTNDMDLLRGCVDIQHHVTVVKAAIPRRVFGNRVDWYQHQADIIRLHALRKWGGVYLDTDVLVLRDLGFLLSSNMFVVGEQSGGGICNGLIVSPRLHPFLLRWIAQYISFEEGTMGLHASYLPMMMARQALSPAVMVISPAHMHWPSYHPHAITTVWLGNWFCAQENLVLHIWGSRSSHVRRSVLAGRGDGGNETRRSVDGAMKTALAPSSQLEECDHLMHPLSPQPGSDEVLAFWPLTGGGRFLREASSEKLEGRVYSLEEEEEGKEEDKSLFSRGTSGDNSLGLALDKSRFAFLPFAGIFNTNQLTITWSCKIDCLSRGSSCEEQVVWSMHTLKDRKLYMMISSDGSGRVVAELFLTSERFSHILAQAFLPASHHGWLRFTVSLSDSEPCRFRIENTTHHLQADASAGHAMCSYSSPIAGVFLFHCDNDDEGLLSSSNCSHVYSTLAEAVTICNRRPSCHGVTLVKGKGFELRSSSSRGVSTSEISWVKESCPPHLAVTDPSRCSSFFMVEDQLLCMRNGSYQPLRWTSGCRRRKLVIPNKVSSAKEMNYAEHGELLLNMQGCSHDGWIFSKDAANGIWLGSLDGRGGRSLEGVIRDFTIMNKFWEGEERLQPHRLQEKRAERVRQLSRTMNLCISEALSCSEGTRRMLQRADGDRVTDEDKDAFPCSEACAQSLSSNAQLMWSVLQLNFCREQWKGDVKRWAFGQVREVLSGLTSWCKMMARREFSIFHLATVKQKQAEHRGLHRKAFPRAREVHVKIKWPLQFSQHFKDDFFKGDLLFSLRRVRDEDIEVEVLFDNMIVGYAEPTFSLYGNDVFVHWPLSKLLEFDVITWVGWHSLEVRVRSPQEEFQSRYDLVWVCIEEKTSTLFTVPDAMKHNRDFFSLPRNLIPTSPEASQVELNMMLFCFEELGIGSVIDLGSGRSEWMAPIVTAMRRSDRYSTFTRPTWRSVDFAEGSFTHGPPALIEVFDWTSQHADVTDDSFALRCASEQSMIIARCLLEYLSISHVQAVLSKIAASGCGYLLITSHETKSNADFFLSDHPFYRPLNFMLDPFRLPPPQRSFKIPLSLLPDGSKWFGHHPVTYHLFRL